MVDTNLLDQIIRRSLERGGLLWKATCPDGTYYFYVFCGIRNYGSYRPTNFAFDHPITVDEPYSSFLNKLRKRWNELWNKYAPYLINLINKYGRVDPATGSINLCLITKTGKKVGISIWKGIGIVPCDPSFPKVNADLNWEYLFIYCIPRKYLHGKQYNLSSELTKKIRQFIRSKVIGKFPRVNFKLVFADGKVVYLYADPIVAYIGRRPELPYLRVIEVKFDVPAGNLPIESVVAKVYSEVYKEWEKKGERFLKYILEHYTKKVPFGIKVRTTDGKCFYLNLQSNFAPSYSHSNCSGAVLIPFDSSIIPYWLRLNKNWIEKHGYLRRRRIVRPSRKKVKILVIDWIVRDFTTNKDYHFKTEEEAWAFAKKLKQMGHAYQLIRPTWSSGFKYGSVTDFEEKRPKLAQTIKPKPIAVTSPFKSTVKLKHPVSKEKAKILAKRLYKEVTTAKEVYEKPMTTTDYTATLTFAPPSLTTPTLPSLPTLTTPTTTTIIPKTLLSKSKIPKTLLSKSNWRWVGLAIGGVTLLFLIGWLLTKE